MSGFKQIIILSGFVCWGISIGQIPHTDWWQKNINGVDPALKVSGSRANIISKGPADCVEFFTIENVCSANLKVEVIDISGNKACNCMIR